MTDGGDGGLTADSGERYERGERIATGGMGEVWRATDTVLGRQVAVKILKQEYAEDPTFRARFEAEARHAAGLHHPGIASVFDYGILREGNAPYLVMELVDGKPLSDLLAGGQPFDPEQARRLALQTAEALAVAHAAGVVHRDVKPANLIVTPDGHIKITDFGIARATDSIAYTQTGQIVGTPQYLSPEQARGETATSASDVYALGVVLFECLSGRRPFEADTPIATALAQIQQDVPPLPDSVPTALADVVNRALAKDPRERYADGTALAAALRAAAEDPNAVPPPVAVPGGTETQVLTGVAAPLAAHPAAHLAPPPAAAPPEPAVDTQETSTPAGGRSRWPLAAAGLLVMVLLAALLVTRPWEQEDTPDTGGNDPSGEPETVRVRRGAYVGKPVGEVEAALKDKDLETRRETTDNPGGEEPGTVEDLEPTGPVKVGSTITIHVWGDPPEEPDDEQPGHGNGNGNEPNPEDPEQTGNSGQGNGQGNGNGTGNGNGDPTDQPTSPDGQGSGEGSPGQDD